MQPAFFVEDLVVKKSDNAHAALVLRTNTDVDTHTPLPGSTEDDPVECHKDIPENVWLQFLRDGIPAKGLLFVQWQLGSRMELIPASTVELLDRSFLIGDIVKRNISDHMSGVVLNESKLCTLQPMCDVSYRGTHTIKGILPPGMWMWNTEADGFSIPEDQAAKLLKDIPTNELKYAESVMEGDVVIYKHWLGHVDYVTNNVLVRLTDNCVVELDDEDGEHPDGQIGAFFTGDLLRTKKGTLRRGRWVFGSYNPNTLPMGTVVSTRVTALDVIWIKYCPSEWTQEGQHVSRPPDILEREELESPEFVVYDRSRHPTHDSLNRKTPLETLSYSELDLRLNLRVRFRDHDAALQKYAGTHPGVIRDLNRINNAGYDLNVFDVVGYRATVTVQWQDLSITTEKVTDLVPDVDLDDEHAAWPGEIAHTLKFEEVDELDHSDGGEPTKRPTQVAVIQTVRTAERMATVRWLSGADIRYSGDHAISRDSTNVNVKKIGTASNEAHNVSLYELETPPELNVRRGDIVAINTKGLPSVPEVQQKLGWLGEIVDTLLDGKLVIRLGAAEEVQDVTLAREYTHVLLRSDFEHDNDLPGDGDSAMDVWSIGESEGGSGEVFYEDEDGNPLAPEDAEDDDWCSEPMDVDEADEKPQEKQPVKSTTWDASPSNVLTTDSNAPDRGAALHVPHEAPPAYLVLDDSPEEHHFLFDAAFESAAHLKRTQKEHKILSDPSALPEGVFVRTWESRLDLLRVLFIGPTETPYALAPIVLDFRLPPDFPSQPPEAFFYSWPSDAGLGGIGRLNPNLYEDGKVCLSLLGTWDGQHADECWNASKSTLLQVIVSVLGLVLVREPYFNEAGYEPLVGTEIGKRPSAHYNERINLRARGFIISALSALRTSDTERYRLRGLRYVEDALRWSYWSENGPQLLDAAIQQGEEVLKRSQEDGEPDGLDVLTEGACIPFRRIVDRLIELRV